MKFGKIAFGAMCTAVILSAQGCAKLNIQESSPPVIMQAVHADEPVTIDGKLKEPIWLKAHAYPMYLARNAVAINLGSDFSGASSINNNAGNYRQVC